MTPTSDPQEPVTESGRHIALAAGNTQLDARHVLSLVPEYVARAETEARAAALAERVLLPGSLEAIRIRDAAFPDRTMRLIEDGDDGMLEAMADRRRLLAHVDALAAASPDSAPAGLDVELLLRLVTLVRLGFLGQTDDSRIVAADVRGKPHRDLLQTILAAPDSEAAVARLRATPASTTGPAHETGK